LETEMSVNQVAYEVGFSSLSSFIVAFRSVAGQLPSDVRKLRKSVT
jgi:AraC-like DNA-binding protein